MSVLTFTSRDVFLPHPERSSGTAPLSNFSIEALISGGDSVRRRSSPVGWGLVTTLHDGVLNGGTDARSPPLTPPAGLHQLTTTTVGWTSHVNLAAVCRRLPSACQINGTSISVSPILFHLKIF